MHILPEKYTLGLKIVHMKRQERTICICAQEMNLGILSDNKQNYFYENLHLLR